MARRIKEVKVIEAASILGVDISQVRRYLIGGLLPGRKEGKAWRIPLRAVLQFKRPKKGRPCFAMK